MASFLKNFEALDNLISLLKTSVFGENNSRLDYFIDHFYGIRPQKREKIIFYSLISSVALFFFFIFLYFFGLHSLQQNLNHAVADTNQLQVLKIPYSAVQSQFTQIESNLESANQLAQVASALDQKAKSMEIQTADLPSTPPLVALPSSHPLAKKFQKARIEYRLVNVSIKKIVDYIKAIQEMPNKYQVTKLDISQIFGTRLYFNVSMVVECYVPSVKK
jgi:hypothetical protein